MLARASLQSTPEIHAPIGTSKPVFVRCTTTGGNGTRGAVASAVLARFRLLTDQRGNRLVQRRVDQGHVRLQAMDRACPVGVAQQLACRRRTRALRPSQRAWQSQTSARASVRPPVFKHAGGFRTDPAWASSAREAEDLNPLGCRLAGGFREVDALEGTALRREELRVGPLADADL